MILALQLVSYHYKLGFLGLVFKKVLGFFLTIDNYLPMFIWPLISNPNWPTNFSYFYCYLKTIIIYLSFASYHHSRRAMCTSRHVNKGMCLQVPWGECSHNYFICIYALVFSPSTPKFCVVVVCIDFG